MKILCVVDNFPPEVNALASRTYEHALEWIKSGHQVTVVTCCPNFPRGVPYPGYRNLMWSHENMNGIQVIRVWSYLAPNAGFLKRIIDFVSFAMSASFMGLFLNFDVIITSSPQFFVNFTGIFLKIFKNKRWIMEVRDLWPESVFALGFIKKGTLYRILSWLELLFYTFSDKIVVVTKSFKEKITSRGIDSNKIEVVFNGINTHLYIPRNKQENLVQMLGLNTKKQTIGYIGTFGEAQDIVSLIPIFGEMIDYNFLLIGDGAQWEKIKSLIGQEGYKNIFLCRQVSKAETPDYYSLFDVGIVPLRRSDTFKEVIPSKIFELAAMEKPILFLGEGEAARLIHENHLGETVEFPWSSAKISEIISKLTRKVPSHRHYQNFILNFNRSALAERVLE